MLSAIWQAVADNMVELTLGFLAAVALALWCRASLRRTSSVGRVSRVSAYLAVGFMLWTGILPFIFGCLVWILPGRLLPSLCP
jgi:hypothetical protein